MKNAWFIIRLSVLTFLFSLCAVAQTANTGALKGEITDPNGSLVAGAQVTMTNESTGEKREVVSQDNGNYTVALLLPGSYKFEVTKQGFKIAVKDNLQINVTETRQ